MGKENIGVSFPSNGSLDAVPSIFYAQMGLGRCHRGKFALDKRPMSIKIPVVPQLMGAVVLMICIPIASLMGC